MKALRARIAEVWRRMPIWGRIGYVFGWLLTSVLCSGIYLGAWTPLWRVDLVIIIPLLVGAVWPVTLPVLIYYLASG